MKHNITNLSKRALAGFSTRQILWIILGAAIATFGIHNIHEQAMITEGGVIGIVLLLHHWFDLAPSVTSPLLDLACYLLAFRFLGGRFIKTSLVSTIFVALFYRLWEHLPLMLPDLSNSPLLAAILGGLFLGVGVGIVVRQGGSSGGDDALALSISKVTKVRISKAYLATDLTVLLLSLSYIPFNRIIFSLCTVMISSFVIDFIKEFKVATFSQAN